MVDPPAKPVKTHWCQNMTKSLIEPGAEVCQPQSATEGHRRPQKEHYNSWSLWLHYSRLAKLGVEAIQNLLTLYCPSGSNFFWVFFCKL